MLVQEGERSQRGIQVINGLWTWSIASGKVRVKTVPSEGSGNQLKGKLGCRPLHMLQLRPRGQAGRKATSSVMSSARMPCVSTAHRRTAASTNASAASAAVV